MQMEIKACHDDPSTVQPIASKTYENSSKDKVTILGGNTGSLKAETQSVTTRIDVVCPSVGPCLIASGPAPRIGQDTTGNEGDQNVFVSVGHKQISGHQSVGTKPTNGQELRGHQSIGTKPLDVVDGQQLAGHQTAEIEPSNRLQTLLNKHESVHSTSILINPKTCQQGVSPRAAELLQKTYRTSEESSTQQSVQASQMSGNQSVQQTHQGLSKQNQSVQQTHQGLSKQNQSVQQAHQGLSKQNFQTKKQSVGQSEQTKQELVKQSIQRSRESAQSSVVQALELGDQRVRQELESLPQSGQGTIPSQSIEGKECQGIKKKPEVAVKSRPTKLERGQQSVATRQESEDSNIHRKPEMGRLKMQTSEEIEPRSIKKQEVASNSNPLTRTEVASDSNPLTRTEVASDSNPLTWTEGGHQSVLPTKPVIVNKMRAATGDVAAIRGSLDEQSPSSKHSPTTTQQQQQNKMMPIQRTPPVVKPKTIKPSVVQRASVVMVGLRRSASSATERPASVERLAMDLSTLPAGGVRSMALEKSSPARSMTLDKSSPARSMTLDRSSPAKSNALDRCSPVKVSSHIIYRSTLNDAPTTAHSLPTTAHSLPTTAHSLPTVVALKGSSATSRGVSSGGAALARANDSSPRSQFSSITSTTRDDGSGDPPPAVRLHVASGGPVPSNACYSERPQPLPHVGRGERPQTPAKVLPSRNSLNASRFKNPEDFYEMHF